jgi:hypothetical protein
MTLPNFIIAGTARSGTTSLYYYLKQHPEIGFPDKKEPKYFSSLSLVFPHNGVGDYTVDNLVVRSFDSYKKLFQGLGSVKRIGDASSDTLYHHKYTAPEILRILGDVPIIICLRNPTERAVSAYNNMLRDQRETLDFGSALAAEENRIENNWDWMWAYKAGGLYAEQVETFQKTFSQVKLVLFEDLVQDANTVCRGLFEFLGVDSRVSIDSRVRYGNSGKPKNKIIGLLTNRENHLAFRLRTLAMKLIPRFALEWIASRFFIKQSIEESHLDELREFFRKDIVALERLIDRDLSLWK